VEQFVSEFALACSGTDLSHLHNNAPASPRCVLPHGPAPVNDAVISWQRTLPGNLVARSRIGVTERYARDPYALWDASIGREFSHLAAHLAFSNLTDTQYQEIEGVAMPCRAVVWSSAWICL
jgi:iron complex outermembrane receptor protein